MALLCTTLTEMLPSPMTAEESLEVKSLNIEPRDLVEPPRLIRLPRLRSELEWELNTDAADDGSSSTMLSGRVSCAEDGGGPNASVKSSISAQI